MIVATLSISVLAGCSTTSGIDDGSNDVSQNVNSNRTDSSGATARGLGSRNGLSSSELNAGGKNQFGIEVDQNGIPLERTIYFSFDSDRIEEKYASLLYSHAEYLKSHIDAKATFKGHTDSRGTREYNMALSERRAKSVKKFMNVLNVPNKSISTVGYGEEMPAMRGDSEEAYSKNRRVVISY